MQQFYVGLKGLVHDPERGILLVHKTDEEHQFWELPGGRMDEGESFEQALTRELQEEIPNIGAIAIGESIGAFKVNRTFPDGIGLVLLYFHVRATIPDPLMLSDEHDGYVFYKMHDDVPEPINPVVKKLLEEFYE